MSTISPDERRQLVQKKAYELYLQRGKTPGREMDDWINAEKLIERELKERTPPSASRPEPAKETPRPNITSIRPPSTKVAGGYRTTG